jgi:hypothetical protein
MLKIKPRTAVKFVKDMTVYAAASTATAVAINAMNDAADEDTTMSLYAPNFVAAAVTVGTKKHSDRVIDKIAYRYHARKINKANASA